MIEAQGAYTHIVTMLDKIVLIASVLYVPLQVYLSTRRMKKNSKREPLTDGAIDKLIRFRERRFFKRVLAESRRNRANHS
jgi:hypothetical protein